MKLIPLSKTSKKYKGMYEAIVDDDIFEEVNKFNWSYQNSGYATSSDSSTGKWKTILMHRFIYEFKNGKIPKGLEVEHIDGNKLNCQISNLRLATSSENKCNRGKQKNNTSGFKGISKDIRKDKNHPGWSKEKWRVQVTKDKRKGGKTYTKRFPYTTEGLQDAIAWQKQKEKELHKKFAFSNRPQNKDDK